MKSLILIRHAKSNWNFDVNDFDRPLNDRGLKDAAVMSARLKAKDINIDAFVSSPAKRALTTAAFFAEAYNKKLKDVITISSLYEPSIPTFYSTLEEFDNMLNIVAVFSHNPSITEFANQLTSVRIDEMPTCAVFAVEAVVDDWKNFQSGKKEFLWFDYPKAD